MVVCVAEASTHPGRITMATAIERYFNVALFLLVLSGFGALASTGGLDLPAVTLVCLALVLRGYQLVTHRESVIPERWTTYLTIAYVLFYLADYFLLSRSFLSSTVHLVLFTMVVRLFSLQRTRDHYMLAILSFLMVLASAVLTVGSFFVITFAGFLLVAVVTFVLMEMRHSVTQEPALPQDSREEDSCQRMGFSLMAIAPALMLLILAGSFFIFFFSAPRFISLPERLHSAQRCFHRLHRSAATGPHWPDSAVQRCRHAHRDPERHPAPLRSEMAGSRAHRFRRKSLGEFLRPRQLYPCPSTESISWHRDRPHLFDPFPDHVAIFAIV